MVLTVSFALPGDRTARKASPVGGVPKSAVLRMWYRDESETEMHMLEVFLLEPGRTCSFGSIDARRPAANGLASQRAEYAAHSDCTNK
jgi:hypothetical protein